jgi:hypothetical protein
MLEEGGVVLREISWDVAWLEGGIDSIQLCGLVRSPVFVEGTSSCSLNYDISKLGNKYRAEKLIYTDILRETTHFHF